MAIQPPNNPVREIPYEMLVRKADPKYNAQLHNEIEYIFIRRKFYGDPFTRGAYDGDNTVPDNFAPPPAESLT